MGCRTRRYDRIGGLKMNRLRPFFSFYGAKWRLAPTYPEPRHQKIIEPFAGSACYSLAYPEREIVLNDLDPIICGVWDYLIHATEEEINALPLLFDHIQDINIPPEAKSLIGFWLNKGMTSPCNIPSKWMRDNKFPEQCNVWGEPVRRRIAVQLKYIRHWIIRNDSYTNLENESATWFIDPPYAGPPGRCYKFDKVDYTELAEYCLSRAGQTIVCEQDGADWLPFEWHRTTKAAKKRYSREAIWCGTN